MNIFIKESLYLLDYNDNVLDVLFLSTDKDTPGQAYEINIKENNTGFSDLTFKMPSYIINEEGEKVINPKLTLIEGKRISAGKQKNNGLVPLCKVRYNRVVRYMGEETISFPGPNGTTVQYPKNDGSSPDDYIIEDYVMDYIIQPLDKTRQSLRIDLTYTAIDFPRFNLSKKKLGLTIDQNTLTTPELSIWDNKPTNVPGSVQYIPWTEQLAKQYQSASFVNTAAALNSVKQPAKGEVYYVTNAPDTGYYQYNGEGWVKKDAADFIVWEPNPQSGGYPLDENSIKKLISQTEFTNGILATVFYWPVKIPSYTSSTEVEMERKTARFEGVTYEKGSFITLTLYNLYDGLELKWTTDQKVGNVAWDWNYLEPNQLYLNPNNACNLLRYILKNTNWSVANDEGAMFIANTSGNHPWFESGESAPSGEEDKYYIERTTEPEGSIRPYSYKIWLYQNGTYIDATKDLLPIVNTDENDLEHFGVKYDVFVEPKEVSRTAEGSLGETMNSQYALNISNANCYNAITSEAKLFNLYPVFDCIKKTVALREHAGADHGLIYRVGRNLKTSNIKLDGEKVITKLYVTGGTDAQGSANINIGEAIRVIEGTTPVLNSPNLERYAINDSNIFSNMKEIQSKAYDLITGTAITVSLNLDGQELVLNFPDNFYTNFFPTEESKLQDIEPTPLMETSMGSIWLRYQASDNTHCFYIYCSDNVDNYLDEKRQLYKADLTNIKVRRNLKTFTTDLLEVVSAAPTQKTIGGYTANYANLIKYRSSITDGAEITTGSHNYLYKIGIGYKGFNLTLDTDGYYEVKEPFVTDKSFVLVGPSRVYKFDATNDLSQVTTQLFIPGNYYYSEENGEKQYYYCVLQNELQDVSSTLPYYDNSALNKLNTISVGNYVFISLGDGSDPVTILNNGETYTVEDIDGNAITYNDWLINNYALRVKADTENHILQEYIEGEEWDPNADEYLVGRSPYGTSYIYNFKYLYDNEWMTREQILDIYSKSYEINAINIDFFNKYDKMLEAARQAYWNAINNLETYESKGDAQLETLMSQYWKDPTRASEDRFSAFPYMPSGDIVEDATKHMYKTNIDYEGELVKTVYFNVFNTNSCNYLYPNSNTFPASASNPETEGQYHVVAKALGWETFKEGQLPLNQTFTKPSDVVDASDTVSNYNKIINNMKLYYWKAKHAGETMEEALTEVEALEELFNQWQESLNNIEKYLQENYGQYIIEGSYNNNEQPYANLLLDDGLKASALYAVPDVVYGVNVVDASGLIEYRSPQILIANNLVKKLHSLGQIVPNVGDYVAIFDDEMGLKDVAGLITTITRRIDDPFQNALTIDTSFTDADELVGQIITATNTILNNKDIYGRANIINSKGELQTGTVTDALSTGKNSLSITSTNGKVVVDDNGLTATNPEDDQKLMRYNGTGVLGSSNGGITWRNLMTQDGINANYIDAGTINTTKVSISDGQYATVFLDGNGLVVKQNGGQNYTVGTINPATLEPVGFNNVKVYIGKDANMNGIGYFDGYINANSGGNIAGWKISANRLTAPNNTTYLSSSGDYAFYTEQNGTYAGIQHNGTIVGNNVNITGGSLKIGNNFEVDNNGNLTASNADINGKITADTGKIGGWIINANTLKSSNVTLNSGTGSATKAINVNDGTFYVQNNGYIYAKSGKIGGWTLSPTTLANGKVTLGNGKLLWEDGSKFFAAGAGTNQPVASAFSAGSDGFSIWSGLTKSGGGSHRATLKYTDPNVILNINGGNTFKITNGGSDARRIELGTANITFRTDSGGIYLRPSGNKQLFIYGSYNNSTKYHTGASGKYEVQVSPTNKQALCFVNGIFVGMEEN